MAASPATKPLFSVAQANAMLPLVCVIMRDLVPAWSRILALARTDARKPTRWDATVNRCAQELRALGLACDMGQQPAALFPTILDGQPGDLHWRQGEPEVLYFVFAGGNGDRVPVLSLV